MTLMDSLILIRKILSNVEQAYVKLEKYKVASRAGIFFDYQHYGFSIYVDNPLVKDNKFSWIGVNFHFFDSSLSDSLDSNLEISLSDIFINEHLNYLYFSKEKLDYFIQQEKDEDDVILNLKYDRNHISLIKNIGKTIESELKSLPVIEAFLLTR